MILSRHDELFQKEAKKQEAMKKVKRVTGNTHGAQSLGRWVDGSASWRLCLHTEEAHCYLIHHSAPDKPLSCWDRLVSLYGSPQVKFYWNIVSYFFFLNLFAGVLMMDFHATPSVPELLLYVWVFSLVCEEFRQVRLEIMLHRSWKLMKSICNIRSPPFQFPSISFSQLFCNSDGFGFKIKAKLYITDLWNILDVLSILLFLLGLAFRYVPQSLSILKRHSHFWSIILVSFISGWRLSFSMQEKSCCASTLWSSACVSWPSLPLVKPLDQKSS